MKATQGDTGHAEIDMITKVYAHILDEDRKINALVTELTKSPELLATLSQLVAAQSGTR